MQDPTEIPTISTALTEHHKTTLTLQPSDSQNSVSTDSLGYGGSIHSMNTTPTRFKINNCASPNIPLDTDESVSFTQHCTTPSGSFTPVASSNALNHGVSNTTLSTNASDEDNAPMKSITPSFDDGSFTYDVIPETPSQPTSWFALNCLPSLKNAAIYLFACGAAAMVTGISLASAPITIIGGAVAGVGLLLGLYGKFNRQRQEPELDLYNDEMLRFENTLELA